MSEFVVMAFRDEKTAYAGLHALWSPTATRSSRPRASSRASRVTGALSDRSTRSFSAP